jgi:hypothetical protein
VLGRSGARAFGCSGVRVLGRSGARAFGCSGVRVFGHSGARAFGYSGIRVLECSSARVLRRSVIGLSGGVPAALIEPSPQVMDVRCHKCVRRHLRSQRPFTLRYRHRSFSCSPAACFDTAWRGPVQVHANPRRLAIPLIIGEINHPWHCGSRVHEQPRAPISRGGGLVGLSLAPKL